MIHNFPFQSLKLQGPTWTFKDIDENVVVLQFSGKVQIFGQTQKCSKSRL